VTHDPYSDPVSGVLINKLGLTTQADLDRAERDLTSLALLHLRARPVPGRYDLTHLRAVHKAIFGDIYAWAGEIRTVAIAKGIPFCLPHFIEPSAEAIFRSLHNENFLRGMTRDSFLDRLTYFFGEVNAIHPFREGNGRTQRAFFEQLANDAGFSLNWRRLDARRNTEASVAIMHGDDKPMRSMLDELTTETHETY
jgi:cell filamentation protein